MDNVSGDIMSVTKDVDSLNDPSRCMMHKTLGCLSSINQSATDDHGCCHAEAEWYEIEINVEILAVYLHSYS